MFMFLGRHRRRVLSTPMKGTAVAVAESDIVKAIITDPVNPPKLVVFKGFVGKGPVANSARIYINHALTDYYELENETDIAHRVKLSEDEGERVWVKHGAKMKLVRSRPSTAELPSLLEGAVAQTHLAQVPVAQPRWLPPMAYAAPGEVPRAGIDWSPADDPYYEVTKCYQGCASYSP